MKNASNNKERVPKVSRIVNGAEICDGRVGDVFWAMAKFIIRRGESLRSVQEQDKYSLIIFDSAAQTPFKFESVRPNDAAALARFIPDYMGGTKFAPPLQQALDLANQYAANTPDNMQTNMIFLTDGENDDTNAITDQLIQQVRNRYSVCKFISFLGGQQLNKLANRFGEQAIEITECAKVAEVFMQLSLPQVVKE